jgi:hypothetical protein
MACSQRVVIFATLRRSVGAEEADVDRAGHRLAPFGEFT